MGTNKPRVIPLEGAMLHLNAAGIHQGRSDALASVLDELGKIEGAPPDDLLERLRAKATEERDASIRSMGAAVAAGLLGQPSLRARVRGAIIGAVNGWRGST